MILGRAIAGAVLVLMTGCAGSPTLRDADLRALPRARELQSVPFFPQQQYQCGPAALATVLVHAGRVTSPESLTPQVYLPQRQGSLQVELLGATRRHDVVPYVLPKSGRAIVDAVMDGYPVLVLQNVGVPSVPFWHYAVVVGVDTARDRVVLRSGTQRRRTMSGRRFLQSWIWGGQWAIVALEPASIPAWAQAQPYLEAAAGLESAARLTAAESAYRAAIGRWPQEHLAWLGLGTVAYRSERRVDAAQAWTEAARLAPDSVAALNNLATVFGELGCLQSARELATRALALAGDGPLAAAALRTQQALPSSATARCSLPSELAR